MPSPAYHPWLRALSAGLRQKCGVAEGDAVLLAVSGGADSVALLRAAALLAPKRGWRLKLGVAHVHHGVRQEAEEEARFVAGLTAELGLPFYRADLDPAAFLGRNLEEAMREARYGALARMARANSFAFVATAHHADDQLETLLLRLCRGCQPEALAGMAWRRPLEESHLIRPLLGAQHADALDFLHALGQDWREDAGNVDERQARAKLRLKVIPVLKELHPGAALKAAALAEAVQRSADTPGRDAPAHPAGKRARAPLSRVDARLLSMAALQTRLKDLLRAAGIARVNSALLAQAATIAADHHGKTRTVDLPKGKRLVVTRETVTVG